MLRTLLRNPFLYSIITKVGIAFFGVLNTVFINRLLGPTLRGEYIYIINIVNLVTLVLKLGIHHSYPYFKRKSTDNIESKYINNIIFLLLFYLFISLILSAIFRNATLTIVFTLIPLTVVSRQLNFVVMIENINLRNKIILWTEFMYTLGLLTVFLLSIRKLPILFLLLYLRTIAQSLTVVKVFKLKISIRFIDLKLMLESIKVGFISMLSLLMITLNYKLDVLILKLFTDYTQIGLYSVGALLAEQAWLISDAFKEVLFSKSAKKDNANEIAMSLKINIVITLFMFLIIAVFGEFIITILFGKEFAGAYSVTAILFAGIMGMVMYKMIYPLFLASGKQKTCLVILTVSVVVNAIFNFVLIPKLGIIGSAAASVISYNTCGWIFLIIFCRQYKLNPLKTIIPSLQDISKLKNTLSTKMKYKSGEYSYE